MLRKQRWKYREAVHPISGNWAFGRYYADGRMSLLRDGRDGSLKVISGVEDRGALFLVRAGGNSIRLCWNILTCLSSC